MEGNKNSGKVRHKDRSLAGVWLIIRSYLKSPSNSRRARGRGPTHVLGRIRKVESDVDMHTHCLHAIYPNLSLPCRANAHQHRVGHAQSCQVGGSVGTAPRDACDMLYSTGISGIGRLIVGRETDSNCLLCKFYTAIAIQKSTKVAK